MQSPQLILARHGQTDHNTEPLTVQGQLDVPLNAVGFEQAAQLAERVANLNPLPQRLVSSTLLRARQTAEIIATRLGLPLQLDQRLAETDRGSWQGRTFNEIAASEPELYSQWLKLPQNDFQFPAGESLSQQQRRVVAALTELQSGSKSPVLVICHGGSIRLALCHFKGQSIGKFHSWEIPNAEVVSLP